MNIKNKLSKIKLSKLIVEQNKRLIDWADKIINQEVLYHDILSEESNKHITKINAFLEILEQLPKEEQNVILQMHFEGVTIKNIAERMNCSEEQISQLYESALNALEESYETSYQK